MFAPGESRADKPRYPMVGYPVSFSAWVIPDSVPFASLQYCVPWPVHNLISELEARNLYEIEGIFRASGDKAQVDQIIEEYNSEGKANLEQASGLTIASALKAVFRLMPQPIIPSSVFKSLVDLMDPTYDGRDVRDNYVSSALQNVGTPEYCTLQRLIRFLKTVSEHEETTHISLDALAVIWLPNLTGSPPDIMDSEQGAFQARKAIAWIICHADDIFVYTFPRPDSALKWMEQASAETGLPIVYPPGMPGAPAATGRVLPSSGDSSAVQARTASMTGRGTGDGDDTPPTRLLRGNTESQQWQGLVAGPVDTSIPSHQNEIISVLHPGSCGDSDSDCPAGPAPQEPVPLPSIVDQQHQSERAQQKQKQRKPFGKSFETVMLPSPEQRPSGPIYRGVIPVPPDATPEQITRQPERVDHKPIPSAVAPTVDEQSDDYEYYSDVEVEVIDPRTGARVMLPPDEAKVYAERLRAEIQRDRGIIEMSPPAFPPPKVNSPSSDSDGYTDSSGSEVRPCRMQRRPNVPEKPVVVKEHTPEPSDDTAPQLTPPPCPVPHYSEDSSIPPERPMPPLEIEEPEPESEPQLDQESHIEEPEEEQLEEQQIEVAPLEAEERVEEVQEVAAEYQEVDVPQEVAQEEPETKPQPDQVVIMSPEYDALWGESLTTLTEDALGLISAADYAAGFAYRGLPVTPDVIGKQPEVLTGLANCVSKPLTWAAWAWPSDITYDPEENLTAQVFGDEAPEGLVRYVYGVPLPVVHMTSYLFSNGYQSEEGIFRIPGLKEDVNTILGIYDKGDLPNLSLYAVATVASALKQYFRDIPDDGKPISFQVYTILRELMGSEYKDPYYRNYYMAQSLAQLTDAQYQTLYVIIWFLNAVAQEQDVNRMTEANIAICWTANILPGIGATGFSSSGNTIVTWIIKHFQDIMRPRFPPPRRLWHEVMPFVQGTRPSPAPAEQKSPAKRSAFAAIKSKFSRR